MANYPQSDHYDGSKFFNPTNPESNGPWAVLKMLFTRKLEDWPASVENSPALDLNRQLNADEAAITFVNHATVLVQTKNFNFLTDPVWSERVSPVTWAGPKRHREPGIPFDKLPKIDFVVISHNHYDHMDIATLRKLNATFHPHFFVPLGNKAFLETNGITNVTELDWWQSFDFTKDIKVSLAPAEHFSGRGLFDRNKTLWGSFVISFDDHTIYFGGDSAYSPHFKTIREHFGAPDLAFLPIGAYEPRWFMKSVHMDPDEAAQAHLDLGANQSIGIHFGTFQLTNESIEQPVIDLEAALKNKNVKMDTFITLAEGKTQTFELPLRHPQP
jgi:L-ascorbate metabolism protein UlaG (beta-lactamase superfamily)